MEYLKYRFPMVIGGYAESTAPDMENFFIRYIGTTADMLKEEDNPDWRTKALKQQLRSLEDVARLAGFDGGKMVQDALAERNLNII